MDQDRLDQLFKDSLFDHKTQIDKDQLWAAINTKQRRRAGWITSLKLMTAILLVAAGAWLINANQSNVQATELEITNAPQQGNTISTLQDKGQSYTANSTAAQDQAIKSSTEKSSLVTEPTENKVANNTTQKSTNQKIKKNQKVTTTTINSRKTTTITADNIQTNTSIITKAYPTALQNDNQKIVGSRTTEHTTLKTAASTVLKNKAVESKAVSTIQELNSLITLTPLVSLTTAPSENAFLKGKDKVKCYDHGKKVHPFYAELYSSVDYVTNRFSATSENLNYKEERDASQTQLEGYRAGLRLKYLTKIGLYFKAGIEFSAIRERFDRRETLVRTEIRPNQLLDIITQSDTTIYIYGDAPVTIEENKIWKVWNTYRTMGIPAMIGYQTQLGKFTCGIELGGIYNLHYDFEGMLLDSNLVPVAEPDYFKSRISSSLTGGINIGYGLSDRMSLMAYSSFKHNLTNINQSNNLVQQANTRIGLGLGLEFKL